MRSAVPALVLPLLLGCEQRLVHAFSAYAYDADAGCLLASGVVDVVAGQAEACSTVRCWIDPSGAAYVTDTTCEGPPGYRDGTQDTSGPCAEALAVFPTFKATGACAEPDAGNPGGGAGGAPPDGGTDAGS